ncbi:MAG: hypothetical protein ACOCZH_06145 [Phototrophicaceae bacterium]
MRHGLPNPDPGRLVIDYVTEGDGRARGYDYVTATRGYDDALLKSVWRGAMPRGRGWASFIGARSIKAFPLADAQIAISEVTVTNRADETGRRGIRRAVIDVMPPRLYDHHLHSRWQSYPAEVTAAARERHAALARVMGRALRGLRKDQPLVLAHPYAGPRGWWLVEAVILLLMIDPPRVLRQAADVLTFTTLALDHRAESRVVAMPDDYAASVDGARVISLYD